MTYFARDIICARDTIFGATVLAKTVTQKIMFLPIYSFFFPMSWTSIQVTFILVRDGPCQESITLPVRDLGTTRSSLSAHAHVISIARFPSHSKSNMEVIVGTYEQVLVGFDVLFGEDELEVACELVKCNQNFSLLMV